MVGSQVWAGADMGRGEIMKNEFFEGLHGAINGMVDDMRKKLPKVAVYYTDNKVHDGIGRGVREELNRAFNGPIIAVSQTPIDFGHHKVLVGHLERSRHSMFKTIVAGLQAAYRIYPGAIVFMAEHDVLYPRAGYFNFVPPNDDTFYYADNQFYMDEQGFAEKTIPTLSMCVCSLKLMLAHMQLRVYRIEALNKKKGGWTNSEPAISKGDELGNWERWHNFNPCIDIRHGGNLSKIDPVGEHTNTVPYWGDYDKLRKFLHWNPISQA